MNALTPAEAHALLARLWRKALTAQQDREAFAAMALMQPAKRRRR